MLLLSDGVLTSELVHHFLPHAVRAGRLLSRPQRPEPGAPARWEMRAAGRDVLGGPPQLFRLERSGDQNIQLEDAQ